MDHFTYSSQGRLHAETIDVTDLAERFGTPLYIYSAAALRENAAAFKHAFAPLRPSFHFAVKSCHNTQILRLLVAESLGMDVVSAGELERARLAGCPMDRVSFAGVGKTVPDLEAALSFGVAQLNVESTEELERLVHVAERLGVVAPFCLRINPNVDARTHKYTTTGKHENKFGLDADAAINLLSRFTGVRALQFLGFHVHLGSPINTPEPYAEMLTVLLAIVARAESLGHTISVLNIGGGFGVDYVTGRAATAEQFAATIVPRLLPLVERAHPVQIILEPGRSIAATAGLLLTTVQYIKPGRERTFAICDAGMHTLIRPALYQAFHFIWPAVVPPALIPKGRSEHPDLPDLRRYDVVGPLCESGDFLAQDRDLPNITPGDTLAVFTAGAYGMTMTSSYNDQPRPAEILVDAGTASLIRRRETIRDLLAFEDGL